MTFSFDDIPLPRAIVVVAQRADIFVAKKYWSFDKYYPTFCVPYNLPVAMPEYSLIINRQPIYKVDNDFAGG